MDWIIGHMSIIILYLAIIRDVVFTSLAVWGLIAFYPKRSLRENSAAGWLVLAIWLGFLGAGLNVFYWKIFVEIAAAQGWYTLGQLRNFGNIYGDFVWKTLGAVSIYLHFYARWKAIPEKDQKFWRPLLMGFYPDKRRITVKMINRLRRIVDDEDKTIGS